MYLNYNVMLSLTASLSRDLFLPYKKNLIHIFKCMRLAVTLNTKFIVITLNPWCSHFAVNNQNIQKKKYNKAIQRNHILFSIPLSYDLTISHLTCVAILLLQQNINKRRRKQYFKRFLSFVKNSTKFQYSP